MAAGTTQPPAHARTGDAGEAAVQEAEVRWNAGDVYGAHRIYRDLLLRELRAAADAGRAARIHPVVVDRLADLSLLLGNPGASDDLLAALVGRSLEVADLYGADYATTKRMAIAVGRGDAAGARAALDALHTPPLDDVRCTTAALTAWEHSCRWPDTTDADRSVLFAQLHLVVGRLLVAEGRYAPALCVLERGLAVATAGTVPLAKACMTPLRLGIAQALLEAGHLEAAGARLAEVVQEIDAHRDPGFFVQWLELAGRVNVLTGNYGHALAQLKRASQICRERSFRSGEILADLNLAHLMILVNQVAAARQILREVLRLVRALGDAGIERRVQRLLRLVQERASSTARAAAPTVTEMWEGDPGDAPASTEPAPPPDLPAAPEARSFLTLFEERTLEFMWQVRRRDLAGAEAILGGLRAAFASSDSRLIRARLEVCTALLAYFRGHLAAAEQALEPARTALAEMSLWPELWQANRLLGWCWKQLRRDEALQHDLAKDTSTLLDTVARTLPTEEQVLYLLNKWTEAEELLAGRIDALARLRDRMRCGARWQRPWRRARLAVALCRLLADAERSWGAVADDAVARDRTRGPATTLRSAIGRLLRHPRARATVSFVVLPDRVLVACVSLLHATFDVAAVTRADLRGLVSRWHQTASGLLPSVVTAAGGPPTSGAGDGASELDAVGTQIADVLRLGTFLDDLPARVRSLTIVSHDSLHGFPFAGVVHRGRFLAEDYAISIGPSDDRPPPPRRGERGSALLIGVSRAVGGLPALPRVPEELDRVGRWLSSRGTRHIDLRDEQARRDVILAQLPRASLCHVACHGVFEPDRPDASGLVLASLAGTDVLSLRDLAQLDLRRELHVSMSSCWAADSFVLPGRLVIGLPETLRRAGAASVLGSLWPVQDAIGGAFMERFYEYAATRPLDDALRRVQLDCLARTLLPGVDTAPLVAWAGFQLYGDVTPLTARRGLGRARRIPVR